MRMVWFKLYDEILEDRKVQTLPDGTFKFWINLLSIANRQKVRGVLPPTEDVAFLLRLSTEDTESRITQLISLGMLDETPMGLSPHNWNERQKKADATSTERSRKHREKRDGSATRPQRVPQPSGTAGDENATKCNAQRREREEEKKEKTTQERVDVLKFGSQPPEQEPAPDYPEGDGGMHDITPSTYPMDQDRARAIFKMLWTGWSNRKMCFDFYQRQQFYQDHIWIAAIRNAKHRDVAVGSLLYIEKIAADYQANGIPKPKPAQASTRHTSPPSIPLPPLHPPGTVIPAKYYGQPSRTGSA